VEKTGDRRNVVQKKFPHANEDYVPSVTWFDLV
jgi:hypothetical protein